MFATIRPQIFSISLKSQLDAGHRDNSVPKPGNQIFLLKNLLCTWKITFLSSISSMQGDNFRSCSSCSICPLEKRFLWYIERSPLKHCRNNAIDAFRLAIIRDTCVSMYFPRSTLVQRYFPIETFEILNELRTAADSIDKEIFCYDRNRINEFDETAN